MSSSIKSGIRRTHLTAYQRNVIKVIDRYVVRCLVTHFRKALKRDSSQRMLMMECRIPRPGFAKEQLNKFMPWLNTLSPPFKSMPPAGDMLGLIARCIAAHCVDLDKELGAIQKDVLTDMAPDASALEMECMLPPPRRERRAGKERPTTLVGKRAARAADSLSRWERKLKFAQNKVKKYRKAVRYYEKKGVLS